MTSFKIICTQLYLVYVSRAYSRFAPIQWETVLLWNDVPHWLSANLEYLHTWRSVFKFAIHPHWGRDKMATILQAKFSNAFSSMKKLFCSAQNFTEMCSQVSNLLWSSIRCVDQDVSISSWFYPSFKGQLGPCIVIEVKEMDSLNQWNPQKRPEKSYIKIQSNYFFCMVFEEHIYFTPLKNHFTYKTIKVVVFLAGSRLIEFQITGSTSQMVIVTAIMNTYCMHIT